MAKPADGIVTHGTAPTKPHLLPPRALLPFLTLPQVKDGTFTIFADGKSIAGTIGVTPTSFAAPTSLADAVTKCSANPGCDGFAYDGTAWRMFQGTLWEGKVGKVKAYGGNLNNWIAPPTAN